MERRVRVHSRFHPTGGNLGDLTFPHSQTPTGALPRAPGPLGSPSTILVAASSPPHL